MAFAGNRTLDFGNNETWKYGVYENFDGTWTAITFTKSATFKTVRQALRWLDRNTSK